MDPSLTFAALQPSPAVIVREAAVFPAAFGTVVIPLSWLSPEQRAVWLLAHDETPLYQRIAAAIEAGMEEHAWRLLAAQSRPLSSDLRLESTLRPWMEREAARLGLGTTARAVMVLPSATFDANAEAARALTAVSEQFAALPWPRWFGPVVVVMGDASVAPLTPGLPRVARAVLPLVRVPAATTADATRDAMAAAMSHLVLTLTAPPAQGWPIWLTHGCAEVAKAKARGDGPSPRQMLLLRQQAGRARITSLLHGEIVDDALAGAVCAHLLHSHRRHLLPNLLDLLRHGADSESALRIAYQLDAEQLLNER